MKTLTMRSTRTPAVFVAAVLMAVMLIPSLFSPAGAADGCGQYSFGFTGTRLLNDGISDVAGPFPIELPAGTYTVTLVAHDHHDTQVDVPTQPGEQYVVVLDSGYTSGPSTDIADDETITTTVFVNQVIEASSAITVRHLGVPGINSVDVVCVGFTPEPTIAPSNPLDPPTDVVVDPPVQDIGDPATVVREPPSVTTPSDASGDTDPVPATGDPVVPEVKGVVVAPAAQLAITGPRNHATSMILLGVLMVSVGAILVRRERRLATTNG